MANHTPGPWMVMEGDLVDRTTVCTIDLLAVCSDSAEGDVTKDAALIAAAPDLLAALRALDLTCQNDVLNPCLLGWEIGKPVQHWGSEPNAVVPACAACAARAAIAKATGGER